MKQSRSGQAMIFVLLTSIIVLFIALWNFDLHKILSVKHKSRNAGDAAALAAARWQGISLNLIGNLNIQQAVAISDALFAGKTNFPVAKAIADLQARLNIVGPMVGLAAAQQAAKNNGIYANNEFTGVLINHAEEVRSEYNIRYPVPPYANDPSPPTAWDNYADMIEAVAQQGIAAFPDNIRYYRDYENQGQPLLNPSFYDAVFTRSWCWFFHNAMDLLENYQDYTDWPDLPIINEPQPINAEFFSLHLRKVSSLDFLPLIGSFEDPVDLNELLSHMQNLAGQSLHPQLAAVETDWFCYRDSQWSPWTDRIGEDFPFEGTIKPQYNYTGADAAIRITATSNRLTPGAGSDDIVWTAAAKPLGYLEGNTPPNRFGLVLPAFHDVRLIPVDTASGTTPGSRPNWAAHIYDHLPVYLSMGPDGLVPTCWYCQRIRTWEQESFRQQGIDWLEENSQLCTTGGGGGGGGGDGGTRHGH